MCIYFPHSNLKYVIFKGFCSFVEIITSSKNLLFIIIFHIKIFNNLLNMFCLNLNSCDKINKIFNSNLYQLYRYTEKIAFE